MSANGDIAMKVRTAKDLGYLIKDRRRLLGLGQQDLARRIGVRRQWVINIEKGKRTAEVGLILKALATLGVDLDASVQRPAQSRTARDAADIDAVLRAAKRS
jgi:HTH-type transcriptional regulator/antitoxin HipB